MNKMRKRNEWDVLKCLATGCHRAYCDSLQTRGEFSGNGESLFGYVC